MRREERQVMKGLEVMFEKLPSVLEVTGLTIYLM